jgi:hypothetical protein
MWEDRKRRSLFPGASATQGISPQYYRNQRTFLIDWKRRIHLISFLDWIHEESMGWQVGVGEEAIFWWGLCTGEQRSPLPVFPHTFPSLFFLDIIEKTYNLKPPISIYLKNTSLYLHALSVLSKNTIHSLIFFDGVLPCCLVEAGVAKRSGGVKD